MSDALNYLLKVRPETLGHYFAFLKDCGKHLDPKTRNLISVITKVMRRPSGAFASTWGARCVKDARRWRFSTPC